MSVLRKNTPIVKLRTYLYVECRK